MRPQNDKDNPWGEVAPGLEGWWALGMRVLGVVLLVLASCLHVEHLEMAQQDTRDGTLIATHRRVMWGLPEYDGRVYLCRGRPPVCEESEFIDVGDPRRLSVSGTQEPRSAPAAAAPDPARAKCDPTQDPRWNSATREERSKLYDACAGGAK